ncbi:MAG: glycoside hydrolase family 88 protein [Marinoscillum sp.]|uniref:glycoside hydrolase family 88 protein n=1 Tax=Marinoscillum sp. TaxID=2024838 RepID=UPI0032FF3F53
MSVILWTASCSQGPKENSTEQVLNHCVSKVRATAASLPNADRMPRNIAMGEKEWKTVSLHDWTSGFWPGILWYAYEHSGDESLKQEAERFTQPIEQIANTSAEDHDIGFQVYCSFGNGYRLTGNDTYRRVMLKAADTLATLFHPTVGTIHSWPAKKEYPHNTIIDNMMNLELLFWASKNGGSTRLYDIAEQHAETTMETLVRSDFSTYHVGIYDTLDGHFIKGITHQGYADSSQWARGQAWAIYGFAISHRETGRADFLETSKKLAGVFLSRLPEDGIPYWDFDDPAIPKAPKDASAACIAACGLLELATLVGDQSESETYQSAAVDLISRLATANYLSREDNLAILLHSTGHYPKGREIDVPIIYADYYFMEALLRLKEFGLAI